MWRFYSHYSLFPQPSYFFSQLSSSTNVSVDTSDCWSSLETSRRQKEEFPWISLSLLWDILRDQGLKTTKNIHYFTINFFRNHKKKLSKISFMVGIIFIYHKKFYNFGSFTPILVVVLLTPVTFLAESNFLSSAKNAMLAITWNVRCWGCWGSWGSCWLYMTTALRIHFDL